MIAALFALAAAMAIGGCAAVIQGFPYVRLESGLAMVIAGSVAASSGAVLFGLGVVAAGIRRVERAARRHPGAEAPDSAEPASSEGRPRLPPVLPPAPAFVVPPVVEPPFDGGRPRFQPGPPASQDGTLGDPAKAAAIEPELPIPGLSPAPSAPPPEPEHGRASEDDLFTAPGTRPGDDAALPLRPSLDAAPEPAPEVVPEKVDAKPRPSTEPTPDLKPERAVVGRYASGGNTYLMFEDGSIEADTPQGRFTFASLDELKTFVDGGGESGARGAA